MSAIEQLEGFLERYDGHLEFTIASEAAWAGELRMTVTNPDNRPSRSVTFYSVGGLDPERVAVALVADFEDWLASSGETPMPVPDWMT